MTSRYADTVKDQYGRPIPGGLVYVYIWDLSSSTAGALEALTTDTTTSLSNPLITDPFGGFYFNAPNGAKLIEVHFAGKLQYREQIQVGPIPSGPPGGPGALFGLFTNFPNITAGGTTLLASSGYSALDKGAAVYVYDAAVNSAYVAANPHSSGITADGKGFRISLEQTITPQMVGADGGGTVDDTAAINVLEAITGRKFTLLGIYSTTLASTAINGPYYGDGQIKDVAGNKRARSFSAIKAAPASLGNDNSVETAFNGDLSKVQVAMEHRITGAATLSQPTSGYVYTNEAYPNFLYLYNSSGWNNSTADTTGRTAACAYRVKLFQAGLGDLVGFNFSGIVSGARAGATTFLANPAVCGANGDLVAANAGVYLNPFETTLHDAGFDVAGVGYVANLDRNNATGALSCYWAGFRAQSIGTVACDAAFSASGKYNVGTDYTGTNFGTNKCALALKSGDRIYGNALTTDPNLLKATSLGTDYFQRSASGWDFTYNGVLGLRISDTAVTTAQPADVGSLKIAGTTVIDASRNSTPASVAVGGGTVLTKAVVYAPTVTPASVAAATVAEQTFTVTGLTTADKVIVNPPAIANATGIAGARVSAADTLAIRFVNPTAGALTPTSGTYTVLAFRS